MLRKSLLAVVLLPALAPGQRSRDASIGVWPWLVGNVDRFQDEIINKAKATGLDTLYMHAWRTTGPRQGELRIADEAGTWNSSDGRLIPQVTLSQLISKAHAAGLQVVAVVQVFRDGGPLPADYAHQDHIVQKVLRYLVNSYDARGNRVYQLDGIALDYIRWFGGNHDGRHVNRFLDEARKEIGSVQLHAYVIASAWYIDGPPYDNSFRGYNSAMALLTRDYGQDWVAMARRLDCILPMAYTANGHVYGTNLGYMEGYLRAVSSYARLAVNAARKGCRIKPAIRTWNDSSGTTTRQTVEACARGALAGGADGFMAFRYFTARSHDDWFQGLARYSEPGPDLPIARLFGSATGLELQADTSASSHAKFAKSRLTASFDLDNDGTFDTAKVALGASRWILPGPGTRRVGARVEDPLGRTATTAIQVGILPFFEPQTSTISIASGGTTQMRLSPGAALGGSFYVVFGTLSGTSPGTDLGGGVHLPVNIDFFTVLASGLVNQGPFQDFFGGINFFGFGSPRFVIPRGLLQADMVGRRIHFAALDLERSSLKQRYASNAIEVRFVR